MAAGIPLAVGVADEKVVGVIALFISSGIVRSVVHLDHLADQDLAAACAELARLSVALLENASGLAGGGGG
jgi:hypothetical protein